MYASRAQALAKEQIKHDRLTLLAGQNETSFDVTVA